MQKNAQSPFIIVKGQNYSIIHMYYNFDICTQLIIFILFVSHTNSQIYIVYKFTSYTYFQIYLFTMNNIKHKILYTREYVIIKFEFS